MTVFVQKWLPANSVRARLLSKGAKLTKACKKELVFMFRLVVVLALLLAEQMAAQTLTTLYSFSALSQPDVTNVDGANPQSQLILLGNTLYGTTYGGGVTNYGTVFAINADGTGFTNLHNFTGSQDDGDRPTAGLLLSGDTLYGTTSDGGFFFAGGTVFSLKTNGTGFLLLHSFDVYNGDGLAPLCSVILSNNMLYGTISQLGGGGGWGNGTVYALNKDDMTFATLYILTRTNNDGAYPSDSLALSGDTLYGSAPQDGGSDSGTLFAISTDGSGFTNLYRFTAVSNNASGYATNSDGAYPTGGLILSGNTLYGATSRGGVFGSGTIFSINTDGTGFTNLHNFASRTTNPFGILTNSDGAGPKTLILSGDTLYGTADSAGSLGSGTAFALNTNGTCFKILHNFSGTSDGASPLAGLIISNTLHGTTYSGGSTDSGAVFSLSLTPVSRPRLSIRSSGPNVILTWPTDATGFRLQSTTNLVSPIWTTNFPAPVVINGQNAVTNPISGTRRFYRLSQ